MVVVIDDKSEVAPPTAGSTTSYQDQEPGPPSYEASNPSTSYAPVPLSDLKPTNHLEIFQTCAPVSGSWKIDTSLQMPRSSPDKDLPNVSLRTRIGTIDANIELAGGVERARLVNTTYIGTIDIKISNPTGQKFDLRCQTSTGTIDIYLPRSFRGPVTLKSDLGSRCLSPGVEKNFAAFSKKTGSTEGFIGNYDGSGYGEDGTDWKGDRLYAQTSIGTIDIYYEDEKRDIVKSIKEAVEKFKTRE